MFDPIAPDLLQAILDQLSPNDAGQLLDILANLGALPPYGGDADEMVPFRVNDAALILALGVAA